VAVPLARGFTANRLAIHRRVICFFAIVISLMRGASRIRLPASL